MAFDLAGKAESTLDKFIGFVVILAIAGATITLIFQNLADVTTAFNDPGTNNTVVDALGPVLGIVLGVFALFGLVKIIRDAIGS